MIAELWLDWNDVRVLLPFVSEDSTRPVLNGVFVEFSPSDEKQWHARLVAVDGKRLAVLEAQLTADASWLYGWPTSFLLPSGLIKRVKKPGKSGLPAKLTLELGVRPRPETREDDERVEEEPEKIEVLRVTVDSVHDPVRCSELVPEGIYPDWRAVVPDGPYVPAEDVTVNGELVADFSVAVGMLDGNGGVAFYRGKADAEEVDETAEKRRVPLIIRSSSHRFFGVLMPLHPSWEGELQLPLWLDADAPP